MKHRFEELPDVGDPFRGSSQMNASTVRESCLKRACILTCYVDGRKRFRVAPIHTQPLDRRAAPGDSIAPTDHGGPSMSL
jgi:hypothetical protein